MILARQTFTCLFSFHFHSNIRITKLWEWPQAPFLPYWTLCHWVCPSLSVFFLSIRGSVRIWPELEK